MPTSASPGRVAPFASTFAHSTFCASNEAKGLAYMRYDECWYCLPCEVDCPTHAITVDIPYLLR
jgi:NAD-dependent dihydropyrimidine dehydrogenase PreA subunit